MQSQQSVIELQGQLLECKSYQLKTLITNVQSSVQETLKAEFQSYSSIVEKGELLNQSAGSFTQTNLMSAVKKVVEEEYRSRNIMLFGLVEEENEELSDNQIYILALTMMLTIEF